MLKTALHDAALKSDEHALAEAIGSGCELDALDDSGMSALHWAVLRGNSEICRMLLEAGANPNVMARDGTSPCWVAVDFGLDELERLIRSFGGKVLTNDDFGSNPVAIIKEFLGQPLPEEDS
jgi:ankyrin repeat protein